MRKKIARAAVLLLFGCLIAATGFFTFQYMQLSSRISAQKEELALFQSRIDILEFENAGLTERNSELMGKYREAQKSLSDATKENLSLRANVEDLEELIKRINTPPVSPDASTPWERFSTAFESFKKGDYGAYWEFFSSIFKNECSKKSYVEKLSSIRNPFADKETVYIDQTRGNIYASVWFTIEGKQYKAELINEGGEWFLLAPPPPWCSRL